MIKWSKSYQGSDRFALEPQAFSDIVNAMGGTMSDGSGEYEGFSISVISYGDSAGTLSIGIGGETYQPSRHFLGDILKTRAVDAEHIEFSCVICGEKNGNISIRMEENSNTGLFFSFSQNTKSATIVWADELEAVTKNLILDYFGTIKYLSGSGIPVPMIQVSTSNFDVDVPNDYVLIPYIIQESDGEYINNGFVTAYDSISEGRAITLSNVHFVASYIHGVLGYIVDTITIETVVE